MNISESTTKVQRCASIGHDSWEGLALIEDTRERSTRVLELQTDSMDHGSIMISAEVFETREDLNASKNSTCTGRN